MPNKPYHHGNLRSSLIDAGIELITQEGLIHLSLRKVAALCGVSQTAPYSHFENKEDLLKAMQDYVTEQFMVVLEDAVKSCPNRNDPYVLIQLGKAYIMFFIRNPQYFSFIFSQTCIKIDLSLNGNGTNNFPPFELFKTLAIHIFKDAKIANEEIEDLIISLWSTVHGLASIATMKHVYYDKDWETKIEDIIWNSKHTIGLRTV